MPVWQFCLVLATATTPVRSNRAADLSLVGALSIPDYQPSLLALQSAKFKKPCPACGRVFLWLHGLILIEGPTTEHTCSSFCRRGRGVALQRTIRPVTPTAALPRRPHRLARLVEQHYAGRLAATFRKADAQHLARVLNHAGRPSSWGSSSAPLPAGGPTSRAAPAAGAFRHGHGPCNPQPHSLPAKVQHTPSRV